MAQLRNLSFTVEEYRARVRKVQTAIAETPLDGLLCHDVASTCYLTGFQSIIGAGKYVMTFVPREGDPVLVAQDFEMYNASISCWLEKEGKRAYRLFDDPITTTSQLLFERGL